MTATAPSGATDELTRALMDADASIAPPGAPGAPPALPASPEEQKSAAIAAAAAEVRGYLDSLVAGCQAAEVPHVAELLPEDRRDKIARAAGAVAVKRNWTVGTLFDRWREEVELAEALAPLLIFFGTMAWNAMKARSTSQPAKPPAVPAPVQSPGGVKKPLFEVNGEPVT